MERRVAFVTGASRGIGKAASLALAGKGYHVVVTARTVKEGESFDGPPLPGSLETTAREIRELFEGLGRITADRGIDSFTKPLENLLGAQLDEPCDACLHHPANRCFPPYRGANLRGEEFSELARLIDRRSGHVRNPRDFRVFEIDILQCISEHLRRPRHQGTVKGGADR